MQTYFRCHHIESVADRQSYANISLSPSQYARSILKLCGHGSAPDLECWKSVGAIHIRQRGSAHEALIIRLLSTCVTKLLGSQHLHHWRIHIIKTKRGDAMRPRQVAKTSGLQASNCALPPISRQNNRDLHLSDGSSLPFSQPQVWP